MSDAGWLGSLKPGDEVAVDVGPSLGCRWHLLRVTRRTAAHIMCVYPHSYAEDRFRAKDGRAPGRGAWDQRSLEPVTDEIRAAVQRDRDVVRLRHTAWDRLPNETLRAVREMVAAVEAAAKKEPTP